MTKMGVKLCQLPKEPEIMNGLVLLCHINVTLYSTGQTVYTNVVPAGGDLSDSVTGLGKTHGDKIMIMIMTYELPLSPSP